MNKIDLQMLANVMGPYLVQILALVIYAGLAWVIKRLAGWLKFKLTDDNWKVVHSTAEAWAGQIWAAASPEIATLSITPASPFVTEAANAAIKEIPNIAKALGITPEVMADTLAKLVASQLGAMQARGATAVTPVVIAAPVPVK